MTIHERLAMNQHPIFSPQRRRVLRTGTDLAELAIAVEQSYLDVFGARSEDGESAEAIIATAVVIASASGSTCGR